MVSWLTMDLRNKVRPWIAVTAAAAAAEGLLLHLLRKPRLVLLPWLLCPLIPGTHGQLDEVSSTALQSMHRHADREAGQHKVACHHSVLKTKVYAQ